MSKLFRFGRGPGVRKVTVPDLSGLTKSESEELLAGLGLTYSSTSSSTADVSLTNKIIDQQKTPGSTVTIGSEIQFSYHNYVAPPYFPYFPTFTPSVTYGPCESYTETSPTCNGEDSYVGIYTGTRRTVSTGGYDICTSPTFTGYGSLIEANAISCGGSGPAPTPVNTSPSWTYSYTEYRASCCASVAIYVDTNPNSSSYGGESTQGCASSGGSQCGPYFPPDFTPAPPDFTPVPPDFTPVPPDFTPAPPDFPYFKGGKGPGCIYADTRVLTINGYVAASEIAIGDKLLTVNPIGLAGNTILDASTGISVSLVDVDVISVEYSIKDVVAFNGSAALYSPAQPIIIEVDDKFAYIRAGDIAVGDSIINIDLEKNTILNTVVESIQTQNSVEVYDIRTAPYQWYIVENNIVIS